MEIKKLIKLQNAIIRAHQKIKDVQNDADNQTREIKREFNKEFNGLNKALEQLNKELNNFTKKEDSNKELERIKNRINELNTTIDDKISKIQLKHGKDGIDGKNGKDGINGRDGKDGINGKDGKNGKDGSDGLSAYEIALKQGYKGTEKEWIDHITNNGGKDYSGQIAAMNQRINELVNGGGGEIPETLYALGADYAEFFEWEDGNPNKEDRTSLFVSIVYGTRKIKKAMEGEDILGITSIDASVIGNAGYKDDSRYSAVGMTGVMRVKDNGESKVGDYVIPGDDGIAIPSTNDVGYKVTARYSDNLIEVLMAHDAEVLNRLKTEIENIEGADLSNYYNKDEINGLANELVGMIPEIVPLEEFNPETQYNDNQITNANALGYLVNEFSTAFDDTYQYIDEVREEANGKIFDVQYTLNPQNMTITYVSHYSEDIIQAYDEGKKVTFRGYVAGLNVYVNSELQLVDGQYVFTYPLLKVNLGYGEKNYFFKIQIASSSTSVEMNEIGEGSGTDDNIFLVEYNLDLTKKQITYVSKTQQEIVNAYNEGKKVMFRGTVTGSSTILVSELNSVDSGLPYTYPFMRTDLGEGIYNYFFRISIYRDSGSIEPYALVDINKLNQTVETLNNSIANVAMSRPTTDVVQNMVNYFVNEAFRGYQNRLLPETADEGAMLKYTNGGWVATSEINAEDEIITVNYQLNPQTMQIVDISHYSTDIREAYNNNKKVTFRGYILGLNVYVNSELEMVDGNFVYTYPLLRVDLGMGMMNYLFRVEIKSNTTNVSVHTLAETTGDQPENITIRTIEQLNVSNFEQKTVKEVEG